MRLDQAGIDLLHADEGCELKAYLDGGGVSTIGWGSTRMFGNLVRMGMTCTQEEADAQFLLDVASTEKCINSLVLVPLTQNQYNGLVDFVYNIGITAFSRSTLLKKLLLKDYVGAANEFMRWVYDKEQGPDPVRGLVLRRRRTKAMFIA